MSSTSLNSVIKIIKNHIQQCGGDIAVSDLADDYRQSFKRDIPFQNFGSSNLIEFLRSISGLRVVIVGGVHHIQTRWCNNIIPDRCESIRSVSPSNNLQLLCVEMKNNLVLPNSESKRKVTIRRNGSAYYPSVNPVTSQFNSSNLIKSEEFRERSPSFASRKSSTPSSLELDTFSSDDSICCSNSSAGNTDREQETKIGNVLPDQQIDDTGYNAMFPPQYIPLSSFYDSSMVYPKGISDLDSNVEYNRKPSPIPQDYRHLTDSNKLHSTFYPSESHINFNVRDQVPILRPVSDKQIVKRLVALMNAQSECCLSSELEFNYLDSYSDTLPQNWLTLLEESNQLYIEDLSSSVTIYPNRKFASTPTLSALPKIQLPNKVRWSVDIVDVRSIDSIWFRLKENNWQFRYKILCHELQKHYQDVCPGDVTSAAVNQLFVVKIKDRVLRVCVQTLEDEAVTCSVIDMGIVEKFPVKNLMKLHEKFTNTPKLALHGSLLDLNQYAKCRYIRQKLETIIAGSETSVIVDGVDGEKLFLNLFASKSRDCINVNEYLLDVIKVDLSLPKFDAERMYDIILLKLDENTAVVNVISPCYKLLQECLRKSKCIIDCAARQMIFAKSMMDVQLNHSYLAKYVDGSWQRVLLKQFVNSTHVVVNFVDFQEIVAMEIRRIVCHSELPDPLYYLPPQAINVRVDTSAAPMLMNHQKRTNMFSMKVVQTSPKLCVKMYLKAPEDYGRGLSNANSRKYCTAV